jgi:hypothetical protein
MYAFYKFVTDKMPQVSAESLLKLVERTVVVFKLMDSPEDSTDLNDLASKYRALKKQIDDFRARQEEALKRDAGGSGKVKTRRMLELEREWMRPPPDDFRNLPIVPTAEELLSEEKAFLRHSLEKGKYDNAQQYLDIQYRLLREDFVDPLRQGVREYFKNRCVG